jgi:hypothetical protein
MILVILKIFTDILLYFIFFILFYLPRNGIEPLFFDLQTNALTIEPPRLLKFNN